MSTAPENKNAPESGATDIEGNEIRITTTDDKESIVTVSTIPTFEEALATLEVGDGRNHTAVSHVIGTTPASGQVLVELSRYDCRNDDGSAAPSRWYIEFAQFNLNDSEIHPRDIPQLIDALNEMRETWIRLDPECFE
ncbi:UNVERIFIED_ORG: hypothetical protein FNL38_1011037 [Nocardia globerula]|uniref:Uncharacterized protein n=1 Tax=Nocardia globerula TaxID=1818 RepID=A0A652YY89_NOCGL|nr:hypothetical protein [Rhodococcus globerulus]NMD58965.1 hypothetical protein [Nocardia globerula]PVX64971.1 hypothetical protein C8E04_2257 [Rhodococcus globerulus]